MLLKKDFKFSKKNIIIGLSITFVILSILYIVMYNNKTNDNKLIEGLGASIPGVDDFTVEDIAKNLDLYPLSNYTTIDIDNRIKKTIDMYLKKVDTEIEKSDKKPTPDEVREYKQQIVKFLNDAGEKLKNALKNALPSDNDYDENTPSYLSNGVVSSKSGETNTQSEKQLNDINS